MFLYNSPFFYFCILYSRKELIIWDITEIMVAATVDADPAMIMIAAIAMAAVVGMIVTVIEDRIQGVVPIVDRMQDQSLVSPGFINRLITKNIKR